MAIGIRLLKDNEAESANNLFNDVYKTNRPIENFRWEFFEGPNGKAIYVVATDDAEGMEKIIGIQCAIPLEFISTAGETILTAKSEDTLVHPGYRGQKLFERMYELLFEECRKAGIQYIWGFTPAVKAFQRLGFEIPFQTSQALLVVKPFDAFRYLTQLNPANTRTGKAKILGLSFLSLIKSFKSRKSSHHLKASPVTSKNQFIEKISNTEKYFLLNQTPRYVTWRIDQNPFGNRYVNYQVKDKADIIVNYRKDVSYIEQMLFEANVNKTERQEILNTVVEQMRKEGGGLIRVLCFETSKEMKDQIALLISAGFTYLRRGNFFVWKSLGANNPVSIENILFSRLFTQGNN